MIHSKKQEKLENLLKMVENAVDTLDDNLSKEEFVEAFENVVSFVKKIQQSNQSELTKIKSEVEKTLNKATKESFLGMKVSKEKLDLAINEFTDKINKRLAEVKDGIGIDGLEGPKGEKGDPGESGSPDSPIQVRDKLETLSNYERLDVEAIKDAIQGVGTSKITVSADEPLNPQKGDLWIVV